MEVNEAYQICKQIAKDNKLLPTNDILIAQKVLMLNATAFILIHNHPSGDSTPSVTDISAAKTISEIGDLIDVSFKDMTILGDDNYTSLKQEGYF